MSRSAAIAVALMIGAVAAGARADVGEPLATLQVSAMGERILRASVDPRDRADRREDRNGGMREMARNYAEHMVRLINDYRARRGLAPLELSDDLGHIASMHSEAMASQGRISHAGFQQRFGMAGSRVCVENVGWNYPHAEAQLHGWRASAGHDRNLLDPGVRRAGVAITGRYVTFFACS